MKERKKKRKNCDVKSHGKSSQTLNEIVFMTKNKTGQISTKTSLVNLSFSLEVFPKYILTIFRVIFSSENRTDLENFILLCHKQYDLEQIDDQYVNICSWFQREQRHLAFINQSGFSREKIRILYRLNG